ncbi:MAG TPA: ABC transporter substrate-binding protein, partial [Candidatus Hypogeohydataceae bacterium YC40]
IAEKDNSQADVFWCGDPIRPLLLEKRGMLEPYKSPNAKDMPDVYKDEEGSWTGFSARVRVLLYNKKLVPEGEVPQSIFDLIDPKWKGQLAMANPLFGTTSIHFAALFCTLGDEKAEEFFGGLKTNGVRVVSSNGEVKRLVSRGEVAVGFTDTDDARMSLLEGKPVGFVYPDQDGIGTLVMPNMVCIIKGGTHPREAKKLIDFLLSEEVETGLARAECAQMPLRPWVGVPEELRIERLKPMLVDYREVADKLEKIWPYLKEWAGF